MHTPADRNLLHVRPLAEADRSWLVAEFTEHFGGPEIASRGRMFDALTLPGFAAEIDGVIAGVVVHTPIPASQDGGGATAPCRSRLGFESQHSSRLGFDSPQSSQPGSECEIVALACRTQRRGAGTALLDACVAAARTAGCRRIFLTTSNDNTPALRFYQKRGWRLAALHRDALTRARELKPHIPLTGIDGIPVRDDIELEIDFAKDVTP